MFRFQHIDYLAAFAAVPILLLLFYLVLKWKKNVSLKIGDAKLVKAMTENFSPGRFAVKFILILTAFTITVLALANPRSPQGTEKVTRNGIDVMFALDVSKSMMAQDIKPSRLERAKQLLGKLIDKLSNDRIGIVVFAGKAYLQMPLTGDHGAAKMYLTAASTDMVPTQGTVIGDALQMCFSSFNSKEKKYKSVILISDGEDHDEGAIKIAGQMAGEGISINTIGIGSLEGTAIIDETTNEAKKDINGNTVITKLNEKELMSIASKGNGIYRLFTNTDEVVSSLDTQLSSMDQRAVTEDSLVNYKNYFPYFLMLALALLVLELVFSERRRSAENQASGFDSRQKVQSRKQKLKRTQGIIALLFPFLILLPAGLFAQSEKAIIKKGNEAYAKKDFEAAITQYKKAAEKYPLNVIAQYNMGNALYRNNKADDAVSAYESAVSGFHTPVEKSRAYYNKGVVLQNNNKLPDCIDAYKNALKLNPEDDDARQNLQKALQQQKEQQQKEKKDKEQKKPKEDEKNKEKQKPKEEGKKEDQPKPQPSKMSKEDAEEKLKALLQQEKNLQDKLKKVGTASPNKPEKDW